MRLRNEVVLPAGPDEVFELINDVERVAPCLPGARLTGKDDQDSYRGTVRIKVGPISAAYSGTVRFLEVDAAGRRLVLDAKGADEHGSGNAEAKVQVCVRAQEGGCVLAIDTDLVIRGKVAQFGGGAIGEVSQRLMHTFADNLAGLLPGGPATDGEAASVTEHTAPVGRPEPAAGQAAEGELNALSLVALPMLKRAAPVLFGVLAGLGAAALCGRLGKGSSRGGSGVLVDELLAATVLIGADRYQVPVRRTIRLAGRR
ncbi:MAG: SRPBCC family protein [Sciscionella sp.]